LLLGYHHVEWYFTVLIFIREHLMQSFHWPEGIQGAVSLSYDDGLEVHHAAVAPLLESHGLCGTFYIPVNVLARGPDPFIWKRVADQGHELGNHSIFHPCRKGHDLKESWLMPCYQLQTYSERRWVDEMAVANGVLRMIDGRDDRTFGNTCCDITIGPDDHEINIEPMINKLFVSARGQFLAKSVSPLSAQFTNLGHYGCDDMSFAEVKQIIDESVAKGEWAIFMTHGVGKDTHHLFMEEREHRELIEYLGRNRSTIWTAPVRDVAQYIKSKR
jgi:hypothetical protein